MHLHSLTIQAIGPFAGKHTIDFASLGQSGLFLLEGPTGAGKSTIIDAIVFALYGDMAGADASDQRMHSHHAAVGVEPFVDMIFETNTGIYRVRRSPAHERPKQRGEGTTKQGESALLLKLASTDDPEIGQPISTRASEIGSEIPRILGLKKEQFLQTVVLPQGEFAKFLRSSGEDRKTVLQAIFRTQLYDSITDQLSEMRREANRAVDAAGSEVTRAVAVFIEAAQAHEEPGLDQTDDLGALERACQSTIGRLLERNEEFNKVESCEREALVMARAFHTAQKELVERLGQRARLLERREELERLGPGVDADRQRASTARRAQAVGPSMRSMRAADKALEAARSNVLECGSAYGDGAERLSVGELNAESDTQAGEIVRLGELVPLEGSFASRKKTVDDLVARHEVLNDHIEQLERSEQERPMLREALEADRDKAQKLSFDERAAQLDLESAHAVVKAAALVVTTTRELELHTVRRAEAVEKARVAIERERSLRLQRLDGMAGELATKLVDGVPCAVCGSPDHPLPAGLSETHPSAKEIHKAEAAKKDADAAAAADNTAVIRLEAKLSSALADASGNSIEQAARGLKKANERVSEAATAKVRLDTFAKKLVALDTETRESATALNAAKVELASVSAEVAGEARNLDADRGRVSAALDDKAESLSQLVALIGARRAFTVALIAAVEAHASASTLQVDQARSLAVTLGDNEFLSVEEAESAVIEPNRLVLIEAAIKEYDGEFAVVKAGLGNESIRTLTGNEQPKLDDAAEALRICEHDHEAALKMANNADGRVKSASRSFAHVREAIAKSQATAANSLAIIKMAKIAEGSGHDNLRKLTLGTFVLLRRFEDVVEAANSRLGPLSDGRYRLQRIDEKEGKGGSQRTGLGLTVLDAQTNKGRQPGTISGGETFYASLCLALGLADVVAAESGGTDLGTLFVDEGFGSLDSETLDRTMAALGRLSKTGRTVGIVSHVEELKHRIGDRIEVRRKTDGSSTLAVTTTDSVIV